MHALTGKVRDFCSSARLNYETKTTYFQNCSLSKSLTYGKFSIDKFTLKRKSIISSLPISSMTENYTLVQKPSKVAYI